MNEILETLKKGLKKNLVPAIILQFLGLGLVLSYYFVAGVKESLEGVVRIKSQHPYLFSALSTAFFGGLFPFLIMWKKKELTYSHKLILFYVLFWAFKGAEIELFYSFQTWLFGSGNKASIIVRKVFFDQLVYTALYVVPSIVLIYKWKDDGFSLKKVRREFTRSWFLSTSIGVVIPNWIVWFPSCAIVYCMPIALQVPLFNIILCFYVLLIEVLCKREV